jgi:hypothetical protein
MKIIKVIKNINRGGFGIIDKILSDDGGYYARKQFSPADQFKSDKQLCDRLKVRFIREVKTQKILPNEYLVFSSHTKRALSNNLFQLTLPVYRFHLPVCLTKLKSPCDYGDNLMALYLDLLH